MARSRAECATTRKCRGLDLPLVLRAPTSLNARQSPRGPAGWPVVQVWCYAPLLNLQFGYTAPRPCGSRLIYAVVGKGRVGIQP
jgi:hypothetical protein